MSGADCGKYLTIKWLVGVLVTVCGLLLAGWASHLEERSGLHEARIHFLEGIEKERGVALKFIDIRLEKIDRKLDQLIERPGR